MGEILENSGSTLMQIDHVDIHLYFGSEFDFKCAVVCDASWYKSQCRKVGSFYMSFPSVLIPSNENTASTVPFLGHFKFLELLT